MRKTVRPIRLFVLISALVIQAAWAASFEDAGAAYDRRDYATAFRLLRPLAEAGRDSAQYWIGGMYRNGMGVPPNREQALVWYRKAADQGHAYAQYHLGGIYEAMYAETIPTEPHHALYLEQAASWWRKAAAQDVVPAQLALALMYDIHTPDLRLAALWYQKAAERGNEIAQSRLAELYEDGKGVPKDYQQAYFWSLLASASGDIRAAKRRDLIEGRLAVQERSAAQAQARIWKPLPERSPAP